MDTEKTKHTPGPWIAKEFAGNWNVTTTEKPRTHNVCKVSDLDDTEANARLIAAAPELLEALRSCLEWMEFTIPKLNETNTHRMNWGGPISKARAAISKATNP